MLVLPVDLTRNQANACLKMLLQGLQSEPGPVVVVDATALNRFDSAALAVQRSRLLRLGMTCTLNQLKK